ncbi:uncharacterized protein LOC119067284 [Bradysia coprophila]|uniref:uncharacterized protein LOC119067284 n=1 Tax=Bradysia coprophila TaxID=38358 RepID=UPI00187D999E|nr:uncharacterized protein LOC119067284 [Bradysia coprophila]
MPNQNHSRRRKNGKNKNTGKGFSININSDNSPAAISRKIDKNDANQEKLSQLSISDAENSVMHNSVLDNESDVHLMKQHQDSKKIDAEIKNYFEINEEYLCKTRSGTSSSGMLPGEKQKVTLKDYGDRKSAEAELKCYKKLKNTNFFVQMIQKSEPPQRLLAVFERHKENIFLHLQGYNNDLLCTEYPRQFLSAVNYLHHKRLVLKFSENPNHIALTSNKMLKVCNLENAKQTTCIEEIQRNVAECAVILNQIITNCQEHRAVIANVKSLLTCVQQRYALMFLIELLKENKMTLSDALKSPTFYSSNERSLLFSNFCKWVERDNGVQKPNLLKFLRADNTFKWWQSKLEPDVKVELDQENPNIEDNAFGLIRTVRNKLAHKDHRDERGAWNDVINDITIFQWAARFTALITFVHQLKCVAEGCSDDFSKYKEITQLSIYQPQKLLHFKKQKEKFKYFFTHFPLPNMLCTAPVIA